jgi:hypothetical protein
MFSRIYKKKSSLNEKGQQNTIRIIDVLFTRTKHNGHLAGVQFSSKRNFMAAQNFKLSLIVLTWLRQLQQFFLTPEITNLEKGD